MMDSAKKKVNVENFDWGHLSFEKSKHSFMRNTAMKKVKVKKFDRDACHLKSKSTFL